MSWIRPFLLFILIVFGVAADQGSKQWSEDNLLVRFDESDTRIYQGSRRVVFTWGDALTGAEAQDYSSWILLQWNYVRNHGAAYGLFANLSDELRLPLFHGLTAVFCAFFLGIALTDRVKISRFARLGLGFMVAGATGNLIDRVMRGFVIDLIDLRWQLTFWRASLPVFNVADVFVVFGVCLLVLGVLRR